MKEKTFTTEYGVIHYWVNDLEAERTTLVFLPGLTADHRLFDKQIAYFQDKYNCLVWDAPGHAASTPFRLEFSLDDKAAFLNGILKAQQADNIVLIGQSMGGYVSQTFIELYPKLIKGFVSIDSAPLQRQYTTAFEIWALRNVEPIYHIYPWKQLIKTGSLGCADSEYGRQLMRDMMTQYTKKEYCALAGHGFRMLADAMASGREYNITCTAILICGEHDRAGSAKRYNKAWAKKSGIPIYWIENAGHNSNCDAPETVNRIIEDFLAAV